MSTTDIGQHRVTSISIRQEPQHQEASPLMPARDYHVMRLVVCTEKGEAITMTLYSPDEKPIDVKLDGCPLSQGF